MSAATRLGADVGGTFTDLLMLDGQGAVSFAKVLSTPPDYDRAVVEAVRGLVGENGASVSEFAHGTTVATNAVLERRGARNRSGHDRGLPGRPGAPPRMRMPHPLRQLLDETGLARSAPSAFRELPNGSTLSGRS